MNLAFINCQQGSNKRNFGKNDKKALNMELRSELAGFARTDHEQTKLPTFESS